MKDLRKEITYIFKLPNSYENIVIQNILISIKIVPFVFSIAQTLRIKKSVTQQKDPLPIFIDTYTNYHLYLFRLIFTFY